MRILRNPVAVVVTLGVAIIPSLYAWFNILANWDPYSSTGNLQVAVANEDKGTASDLVGRLDAGKQVVSQLKKNDRLGWTFVSADKAVEGVQSGEYYAAIVLPKDFSESLINSITGSSDKPNIIYYVNEKKNAIAPKITDTGATTIDSQINATFVSTVSKTLVQTMTKEGGKLSQSADGTRTSVVNDLNGLIEQLNDIDSSLGRMGGTFDDAEKGIKQAKSTVASLKRQISSAQKAAKQSQRLLTQVQGSAQSFSSSLAGAFDNGSVQLSGIGVSVNNAAGDALSAFNTAQGSIDDITNALQKPIDGAATLSSDLKDAMNKAGIGRDTAIGKQIWQQIRRARQDREHPAGPTRRLPQGHVTVHQLRQERGHQPFGRHQHRHRQRHRHTQPRTHDAHRNRHPEPDRGIEQLRHAQRHNRRHAVIAVIHARPVRQPV